MESITVNIMETKHNKNIKIYRMFLIVFGLGVVVGVIWLSIIFYQTKQANEAYAKMQEQLELAKPPQQIPQGEEITEVEPIEAEPIEEEPTEVELIEEKYGIKVPEKTLNFETLKEECEDIYAWINVPGTKIDYPVLQHPTNDTYYLDYNMDGSKGYPGAIYTESINAKDFSDPQTVLYGHNMKNGTMFANLHNFEDRDFFDENRYIFIYTEEKTFVYEIYAAYTYSSIHLIKSFDLSNKGIFQTYLDGVFEIKDMTSNIRTDLGVNSDSHIITLSTCISGKPNNRYLVQGVLINED